MKHPAKYACTAFYRIILGKEDKSMDKAIKRYFPIFVLPTLLAFTMGFIAPFLVGVWLSFCKFTSSPPSMTPHLSALATTLRFSQTVHLSTPCGIRLYLPLSVWCSSTFLRLLLRFSLPERLREPTCSVLYFSCPT